MGVIGDEDAGGRDGALTRLLEEGDDEVGLEDVVEAKALAKMLAATRPVKVESEALVKR